MFEYVLFLKQYKDLRSCFHIIVKGTKFYGVFKATIIIIIIIILTMMTMRIWQACLEVNHNDDQNFLIMNIIIILRQACLEAENKGRRLPFTGEDMDQELAIEVRMKKMRMMRMLMRMMMRIMRMTMMIRMRTMTIMTMPTIRA